VKLNANGQSVEFTASGDANSMIIRFCLPDGNEGKGSRSTLLVFVNNQLRKSLNISSEYTMLYGKYPFTNEHEAGSPRNYYDEVRINGLKLEKGDLIKIQRSDKGGDDAEYCIIDLIDLEAIEAPLLVPANSLSITDQKFTGFVTDGDYTEALRKCVAETVETGKIVWIPEGTYQISGDIVIPSNAKIQGAGMWRSVLVGNENLYREADKRVRLKGTGSNIHLADFAIVGKLNYRSDQEPNDGIVGSFGENSIIRNIWIEHTKVGIWVENSKSLAVENCRFRNTIADGINFCVGMRESTIRNCTARGTGDDCFAIWPATFMEQKYAPGKNLITHCTGQLPFLANGVAIYGGESNRVSDCLFTDISAGSAILISTTFPTENTRKGINNNFSGVTVVENCDIKTSGGFDHEWDWRAAVQICADRRTILGIELNNLKIEDSLSDGLSVVSKSINGQSGELLNAEIRNVQISNFGLGVAGKHRLWIQKGTKGELTISDSVIPNISNESDEFGIIMR
jgi:hypothetical protein